MSYEPGVYQKGDESKRAATASEAVALAFQGFKRVDESEQEDLLEGDGPEAVDSPDPDQPENPDAPEPTEPESPLDGAEPNFDEGSPSEENTSADLDAHQSGYTF